MLAIVALMARNGAMENLRTASQPAEQKSYSGKYHLCGRESRGTA